jgi:hypothetical protein
MCKVYASKGFFLTNFRPQPQLLDIRARIRAQESGMAMALACFGFGNIRYRDALIIKLQASIITFVAWLGRSCGMCAAEFN